LTPVAASSTLGAMQTWRGADGMTLVELLLSLGVLGLVLAGVFSVLQSTLKTYGWGAGRVEAQQSARLALERMTTELREAGYDPRGAGIEPFVEAEPTLVTFQRDLNGNGVVDATRERVTFLVRPGENVLRRDAGAGAQPIIDGVRRFRLSYFDRAGQPVSDPSRVTLVRLHLEVGRAGAVAAMQTDVSIRNARPR
jgi:type II secretory pathway component PulJ